MTAPDPQPFDWKVFDLSVFGPPADRGSVGRSAKKEKVGSSVTLRARVGASRE